MILCVLCNILEKRLKCFQNKPTYYIFLHVQKPVTISIVTGFYFMGQKLISIIIFNDPDHYFFSLISQNLQRK
jgi:hypothetical protein